MMSDHTGEPEKHDGTWSNHAVGSKRLTWRELAEQQTETITRLQSFATILSDLDRCEHGRHEGDDCFQCEGPSKGNPLMACSPARNVALVARQIGFTLSGGPLVIPDKWTQHDPDAWEPPQLDGSGAGSGATR